MLKSHKTPHTFLICHPAFSSEPYHWLTPSIFLPVDRLCHCLHLWLLLSRQPHRSESGRPDPRLLGSGPRVIRTDLRQCTEATAPHSTLPVGSLCSIHTGPLYIHWVTPASGLFTCQRPCLEYVHPCAWHLGQDQGSLLVAATWGPLLTSSRT